MTRSEELSQMVELLRDTAKLHQPNEEILTDVKAESFIFVMDSVLSALSVPEREKGTDTFGFREATKEERESVDTYIKSISFPEREKGTEDYDKLMTISQRLAFENEELREMLSAVPKKGEWLEKDTPDAYRWKCSCCGLTRHCKENFCPNCGADMRGDKE